MRAVAVLLPALAAAVLASACGGAGGGDLTGEVDVPEGYEQYSGSGVSFVYPKGWKVDESADAEGVPSVQITAPDPSGTPGPLIQLVIAAKVGDRFDSFVEQRRVVVEQVNDGTLDSEKEVKLAGAKKTLRTTATMPPRGGSDPVEVKSAALEILRDDGDVVVLTAADPQRDGAGLDREAVIDSFRFAESA